MQSGIHWTSSMRAFLRGLPDRLRSGRGPIAVLLALAVSACGGGGGGEAPAGGGQAAPTGQVVIGITDAAGEFLAYAVDVQSLQLVRASGAVVETLPNVMRIDFARYTELTEFLTAATVPTGVYTEARLRLDFTDADVRVEDAAGNAVPAIVRDANGNPATTLEVTVKLDGLRHMVVAPGIPAHVTLDFNLEASNRVDLSTSPPTVTVQPVLVADVTPEQPKPHRVRGPLASVDPAGATYRVHIRPFPRLAGNHGELTVSTAPATVFEIDGVNYQGNAGLVQLAAKPTFTATVAIGTLDVPNRRFNAEQVYAGSSVAFGTSDVVIGSVAARSGNTLTIMGGSLQRADGTLTFADTLTVNVASGTRVTRAGEIITGLGAGVADLSVGSAITAFGTVNGTMLDATGAGALVRIGHSVITGTVNATSAGMLRLNLQRINGRRVGLYNFGGTGAGAANDAQPIDYEVNTAGLIVTGVAAGSPVRSIGFVQPFGQAPEDFDARSVINLSAVPGNLVVDWEPDTASPFVDVPSARLTLDLATAPNLHHLFRAAVAVDLKTAPYSGRAPAVQPDSSGRGLFAIARPGTIQVYTTFDGYVAALIGHLANGERADGLIAHGTFDDPSVTMTSRLVATRLR